MEKEELNKLFDFYTDTLNKCGIYLLNEDDETIEYNIFEEFDIGVVSALFPENTEQLCKAGLISENKKIKSQELRDKVMKLQNTEEWTIISVKNSAKWRDILLLSDEIKSIK